MNKAAYILFLVLVSNFVLAQATSPEKRWQDIQERIQYKKPAKPKGPPNTRVDPVNLNKDQSNNDIVNLESDENSIGKSYTERSIERSRNKQFGKFKNGSGAIQKKAQESSSSGMPEINLPEIDPPDIDLPDIDAPDIDAPNLGYTFWKVFFICIAIVLLALFIYHFFLKNMNTQAMGNQNIVKDTQNIDLDPTQITKTELEQKLQKALAAENYRECVRIYYTFILKELITNGWIKWEAKKTNIHYLLEMASRKEVHGFNQSVSIFELVWYGKYNIRLQDYKEIEPDLKNYYSQIKQNNVQ